MWKQLQPNSFGSMQTVYLLSTKCGIPEGPEKSVATSAGIHRMHHEFRCWHTFCGKKNLTPASAFTPLLLNTELFSSLPFAAGSSSRVSTNLKALRIISSLSTVSQVSEWEALMTQSLTRLAFLIVQGYDFRLECFSFWVFSWVWNREAFRASEFNIVYLTIIAIKDKMITAFKNTKSFSINLCCTVLTPEKCSNSWISCLNWTS